MSSEVRPPAEGRAPPAPARRLTGAAAALLVLAAFVCYANSLRGPFLFDDLRFTAVGEHASRPIQGVTISFNRWISTSDTLGYHLVNVTIHALAGLVLFGLVRRTLAAGAGRPGRETALAFAVALLWLVHPLQTGAVSYLTQRAEALASFFYLATLYAFVRSLGSARRSAWQDAALAALVLGFGTKEIVATAPFIVLLYDRTFVSGSFRSAWRLRKRFHLLLFMTTLVLAAALIGSQLFRADSAMGFRTPTVGWLEYTRSQPGVILHYLRLALWPDDLCFDYLWPVARGLREWVPQTLALGLLLAATLVGVVRRTWLGFAGAWFFVILAPTSSIVPIQDLAFEHRMYLPLAAVVLVVVVGLAGLLGRMRAGSGAAFAAAVLVLALALGTATIRRNRVYRSALDVWTDVLERTPDHWRAHLSLGMELHAVERFADAIPHLVRSLELHPHPYTCLLLGRARASLGQLAAASAAFDVALEMRPEHAETLLHRGNTRLKLGDLAGAERDLERSLALGPTGTAAFNLGLIALRRGQMGQAEGRFRRALELAPDDPQAWIGLARALAGEARHADAADALASALRLAPDDREAHGLLGSVLAALGRTDEARAHLRRAGPPPQR